ncbi:MAG: tRNA pseudouridine(38-40) synthase TruA [Xanthomonadaceae bacterium]|nr:tRNA pseudouridine(38-40) synthase TruA [Xanthomonadaceae bacterium]MDE1960148.1 tRNA pseudouridine(38-40) synthase TruA [Xanthomonadaceae bacterium]
MRIALGIEYDGTDFLGWQRLAHGPTVQAAVETALSEIAAEPVQVICAGRTDAGVHARNQVIHFDTQAQRTPRGWTLGTNSRLPASVAVRWARAVADDFHARFSARARRYRYIILNRSSRPALEARHVCWERATLDVASMHAAAQTLVGEHDFSAFRTAACQARSPLRCVQAITVVREGDRVVLDIQANAFLHHMVRNIAGSLRVVGRGEQPPQWIQELLAGRDRTRAGPTSAASGLVFLGPLYPAQFGLPAEATLP